MLKTVTENTRRTFIVVQDFSSFRFSWRDLYAPDDYDLILITNHRHYEALEASGETRWFSHVIRQSNFDDDSLTSAVTGVLERFGVGPSAAHLLCNDEDTIAVTARVAERLSVESLGHDFVRKFTNKLVMKQALSEHGVRVPRHVKWETFRYKTDPARTISDIEKSLGYPCFAKPLDGSGSINTQTITSRRELADWCEAHAHEDGYEIDEFIDGTLYHCDSIINKGNVTFTQVSRYFSNGHNFLSGCIDASITLAQEDPTSRILSSFTERALRALRLDDRCLVTHMEVFIEKDGQPVFLEVAARAPGGRVVPTYERRLGLNLEELNFRLQMGLFKNIQISHGPYAAWASFPSRAGTVAELHKPFMQSSHTVSWRVAPGDLLKNPRDVADYVVAIEAWNQDQAALETDMVALKDWLPCSYA